MKDKLIIFLKKYPLFLYLLPVFFVLHGTVENYDFVPLTDAALLTAIYLGCSIVLFLLCRLVYRDWMKAALYTFLLMSFHFFFGSIQDGLRHAFPGSFLSKYLFILPASLGLFICISIFLKKRKKPLNLLGLYLNFLFFLLIIIDAGWLLMKISANNGQKPKLASGFIPCPDCATPDVYIIIADEYAGNKELKDIFHFDDSLFLQQLADRDFHTVANSSSNYNYTPYSIASTLNMEYLAIDNKHPQLSVAYETINNNNLLKFFQYHQYRFYNYSFFDFTGHPSYARETFLPVKTRLITGQTFLSRIEKELRFHLIKDFNSESEIRKTVYDNRDNNKKLVQLLAETTENKSGSPKFVLTHLMMPHYPYYYDKDGKALPFEMLYEGNQVNKNNYIGYLQYSNKKLLESIDEILQNSATPPIIVLLGDHGFRHFTEPVDPKYYFYNLVSIHLPGKTNIGFADNLTNVNLFRAVLNESFGQHLPYLKDTTLIVDNP